MPPHVWRFWPTVTEECLCESYQSPEPLFFAAWCSKGPPGRQYYAQTKDQIKVALIQTDGACLDNGGWNPHAGAGFVYGPQSQSDPGCVEIPLDSEDATSDRAELVAVIQALAYENWWNLFDKLVIATDSEYVVQGCTERYETWDMLDWWTPRGRRVSNTDLWIELMELIDVLDYHGCAVEFWKIPRRWNSKADAAAKRAAATARATAYSYSANVQTVLMGHTSIVSST